MADPVVDVKQDFRWEAEKSVLNGVVGVMLKKLKGVNKSAIIGPPCRLTSSARTNLCDNLRPKSSLRAWHFRTLGLTPSSDGACQLQPTPGMSDMGRKVLMVSLISTMISNKTYYTAQI